MTTLAATPDTALTAVDRCDRCGVQAYVRVTLAAGGHLLFCGHHFRAHEEALRDAALHVHDETARLVADATAAPSN